MTQRIHLSPPHMTGNELKYIQEAFDQNWIAPLGPNVKALEEQCENYLGEGSHCVAMSSGTAAIHIALKHLGVSAEDEVFCSSLTFVASANPILYLGAKPVFIDCEKESWNLCPDSLEKALSLKKSHGKLPKAIIVVDLLGQSANYDRIAEISNRYQVPLIEDAAEAFGASYKGKKCGTFGKFGILSFNGNKIITTSGGGMLVCPSLEEKQKTIHLITQARDEADYYLHSEVGHNYRMSNILAGIGRAQVEVLDERVKQKREVNEYYKKLLLNINGIEFMPEPEGYFSNRWLTTVILKNSSEANIQKVYNAFKEENIDARYLWKPLHTQPLFKNNEFYGIASPPISETLFQSCLCLPSGTQLQESQIERIAQILKKNIA